MASDPRDDDGPTRLETSGGRATAVQLQRISLRVLDGPDVDRKVVLEGERIRIGTGSANDLVLGDSFASRLHAEVVVEAGGFRLVDLGSRNGTFVGTVRVRDAYLSAADRFRIGHTTIRLETEDGVVRLPLSEGARFGGLVGESVASRRLFDLLARAAKTDGTVLLLGETGTGKEEAARAIHEASPRAQGPFVVVDCGAAPGPLLGSMLFGHEKGSFTGADRARSGAFEQADGGTIFLDEIGELAEELQPHFLRVLERREVQPLGSTATRPVHVRVIAATHRDLRRDVNEGRFRADLYFRLAILAVELPPLRDRIEDLALLSGHLIAEIAERAGVPAVPLAQDELRSLRRHHWPGNVRELRNVLERRALLGTGLDLPDVVDVEGGHVPGPLRSYRDAKAEVVDRFERAYVADLLARAGGNVSKAARDGRMDRTHLIQLVRKHGLVK